MFMQNNDHENMLDKEKDKEGLSRKEFLKTVTYATAGLGLGVSIYPFIASLEPTKELIEAGEVEIDISDIKPGDIKIFDWRNTPVFVLRRTPEMIKGTEEIKPQSLIDPATVEERTENEDWLVCIGICTHLGCIPAFVNEVPGIEQPGFFCACHAGRYDSLGRRVGGPPPENLHLIPYEFVSKSKIKMGTKDFGGFNENIRKIGELPRA